MKTVTGYRVGNFYHLEPQSEEAQAVTIVLRDDVRVAESAKGQRHLYREHLDYGMTLVAALALGWCRIAEEEERPSKNETPRPEEDGKARRPS